MRILSVKGIQVLLYQWFSLLITFTPARLLNFFKLHFSYRLSLLRFKPKLWGFPWAVSIEPTTACNLKCPECPSGSGNLNRPSGNLSQRNYEEIIKKIPRQTSYLTLYFQGEPYLNKHFFDMVKFAKQQRMFVATSTNGHFLNEGQAAKTIASGLNKLIISLDGADAETYLHYRRGGEFEKVISGIKQLVDKRNKMKSLLPLIVIQFLVFKQNEHQIKNIEQLARELGADVLELKTAQHYDFEDGNEFMTSIKKYSRYRKNKDGKYIAKSKLRNRCLRLWTSCVITWDGSVVPCCYDKDARYCFGNILQLGFKNIWKGEAAQKFREKLWKSRKTIGICSNCHE